MTPKAEICNIKMRISNVFKPNIHKKYPWIEKVVITWDMWVMSRLTVCSWQPFVSLPRWVMCVKYTSTSVIYVSSLYQYERAIIWYTRCILTRVMYMLFTKNNYNKEYMRTWVPQIRLDSTVIRLFQFVKTLYFIYIWQYCALIF